MNRSQKWVERFFEQSFLPLSFYYGGKKHIGLGLLKKVEDKRESTAEYDRYTTTYSAGDLRVRAIVNLYRGHDALDYTLYFTNVGQKSSKILKKISCIDLTLHGKDPILRGILGDHVNRYLPYEKKLAEKNVSFRADEGRATHVYFPFFDWNGQGEGVRLAIGWGGTWKARFDYDKKKSVTYVKAESTIGLMAKLRPGETVRTARVGILFYSGGEEEGVNRWRRFVIDRVMPKWEGRPVGPFVTTYLAWDTGRPNSDGSVSEYDGSYERSLETFYGEGLTADFRWFDAGWYFDPYGKTIVSDWHRTGSWELDKEKWKGDSFRDSVRLARKHGTKTLVWFEPEAVTGIDSLVTRFGYKKEWALVSGKDGRGEDITGKRRLNNLGNEECEKWTKDRILTFLKDNEIDMYREDMNMAPASFWRRKDKKEGFFRKGMTENKYMQGHYKLWDEILEYCEENDKCTFIDSCASGGGRNDFETMFRSIPILRSDSDRVRISMRLAYSSVFHKWIPFSGCAVKEAKDEMDIGHSDDIYVLRASYLPAFNLIAEWYHKKDSLRYDLFRQAIKEWKEIKEYFYRDFYLLTPYARYDDETKWTVFEYFDEGKEKGVVQAFRQNECPQESVTVRVRGIKDDGMYKIRDIDNGESVVDGVKLKNWTIVAPRKRTALIFYIERVE